MKTKQLIVVAACGAALFACDSSSTSANGDGGVDASASVDLASSDGAAADLSNGADSGGPCPDVFGKYSVAASGQGCGDLNANAPQCIQGTNTVCAAHFVSAPPGGTGAVNGMASLKQDGSFDGAALIFGTVQRSGCTGTWDPGTSTMTVDCGGTGSSQSCVVTLVRTASTCP